MYTKDQFLTLIESHIKEYGYHVTTVTSVPNPRFAYTIGLRELFNFELVFAGGIIYLKDELSLIFNAIVEKLKKGAGIDSFKIEVENLGSFSLVNANSSWCDLLLLGVSDYYKIDNIKAFQIVPDSSHYTLDIPDLSKEWDAFSEPIWQWLNLEWNYSASKDSTVVTDIDALMGEPITEVMRWENNEWEMFTGAGPEIQKENMRVVPLGTILGIDQSILPAINLNIGKGLWRHSVESEWNNWG